MNKLERLEAERARVDAEIASLKGDWPRRGDTYWIWDHKRNAARDFAWENGDMENGWKRAGLCFMTKSTCEQAHARVEALELLRREVRAMNIEQDWTPDLSNTRQFNYFPEYDAQTRTLQPAHSITTTAVPIDLLSNSATWRHLIEKYKSSVLLVLGITPPQEEAEA